MRKVSLGKRPKRGMALITTLLIVVMLTLLAVSMFRGFGLQQKIAGNTRDKERSYQVAQSVLQFGEDWLQGGRGKGSACTATNTVTIPDDLRVCSNALIKPDDPLRWVGQSEYTLPAMIVAAGGGVVTDKNMAKDINYSKVPGLYINYIGDSPSGTQQLYTVTAAGYGGVDGTTSVVQSVYSYTTPIDPLSD